MMNEKLPKPEASASFSIKNIENKSSRSMVTVNNVNNHAK